MFYVFLCCSVCWFLYGLFEHLFNLYLYPLSWLNMYIRTFRYKSESFFQNYENKIKKYFMYIHISLNSRSVLCGRAVVKCFVQVMSFTPSSQINVFCPFVKNYSCNLNCKEYLLSILTPYVTYFETSWYYLRFRANQLCKYALSKNKLDFIDICFQKSRLILFKINLGNNRNIKRQQSYRRTIYNRILSSISWFSINTLVVTLFKHFSFVLNTLLGSH